MIWQIAQPLHNKICTLVPLFFLKNTQINQKHEPLSKSVEKKYLNELNVALIDEKFLLFQNYFGTLGIQENIRNAKEEQFQEGFLRELFVRNISNYAF